MRSLRPRGGQWLGWPPSQIAEQPGLGQDLLSSPWPECSQRPALWDSVATPNLQIQGVWLAEGCVLRTRLR